MQNATHTSGPATGTQLQESWGRGREELANLLLLGGCSQGLITEEERELAGVGEGVARKPCKSMDGVAEVACYLASGVDDSTFSSGAGEKQWDLQWRQRGERKEFIDGKEEKNPKYLWLISFFIFLWKIINNLVGKIKGRGSNISLIALSSSALYSGHHPVLA